ncbi:MAG: site-specific DNA-methyltransferase, partial [Anaerolineae bacterium]|nr:site-specific DNA-methyltransferase [Anaerolineae bacterium]
ITGYPTEKSCELLARIIEASSNEGDLVLDCFSGSGTTLAVASRLGRHWIGMDNSSEAIATTLRRFAHGLEPMGDFVSANGEDSLDSLPLFRFANLPETSSDEGYLEQGDHVIDDFVLYSVASHSHYLREGLDLE